MARRALLVGIDNYSHPDLPNLRGCINDVARFRSVLKEVFRFENDEIRVVVDDRATKAGIVTRLNWLVGLSPEPGGDTTPEPGDVLVFFYSGHGSQIRDRDNDELRDGLDEVICPHDMNWDDGFIRDDYLEELFGGLPEGVLLEALFDTCFWGPGLRAAESGLPGGLRPQLTHTRFIAPPVDIAARYDELEEDLPTSTVSQCVAGDRHVVWAATAEGGTAEEAYVDGVYNGVFTYSLCRLLEDTGGQVSRQELAEAVAGAIQEGGYRQEALLEAPHELLYSEPLGGELLLRAWTPFDL